MTVALSVQTTMVNLTFACRRLPFVVVTGLPAHIRSEAYGGQTRDAADAFTQALGREVQIVEGELHAVFDDPVEMLVAARAHNFRFMRFAISPATLQLLREPNEPARSAWQWLRERLAIPDDAYDRGIARFDDDHPIEPLPAGIDDFGDREGVLLWLRGEDSRIQLIDRPTPLPDRPPGAPGPFAYDLAVHDGHWSLVDCAEYATFVFDGQVHFRRWLRLIPGQVATLPSTLGRPKWLSFMVLSVRAAR